MSIKYKSIIVIPDSHAHPDYDNNRFSWLANYILEKQPDIIVDIGDSADMASLCHYDMGTLHAEGRRYKDDLHSYHDAMEKLTKPLTQYNNTMTQWRKRKYRPLMFKCTGNHENRINRAATEQPQYFGHIDMSDLREAYYGWQVIPFMKPLHIENICFQHYFASGVMGRPISGEYVAGNMVKKGMMSCVAGHSHLRDYWETTDVVGRKRFGLVVGCYFDYTPAYTTEAARWWRGIVRLHDVHDGSADPEFINIDYLKRKYS